MNSIRVLHVVESLSPEAGCVAISLAGLFRCLSRHGIESAVLTDEKASGANESITAHYGSDQTYNAVGEASVVHVHGWNVRIACDASNLARKLGRPYVISPLGRLCDGPYVDRHSLRQRIRGFLRENKLLSRASAIAAVNKKEHDELVSQRVVGNPILLPYGLDFDAYTDSPDSDGTPDRPSADARTLLVLGPIHPIEGLVPFMKAFAEIGAGTDGWNMAVGGMDTGDWRAMLEAAVRRKGGSDQVRFVPADTVEQQRGLLDRATVLACPSLHFRAPVSIMQAVAAGVSVITSDRAAPDGMEDVTDICRPTRSDFRETLRTVLGRSEEQRAVMARKARDIARNLYDWSVLANRHVQLYRGLT